MLVLIILFAALTGFELSVLHYKRRKKRTHRIVLAFIALAFAYNAVIYTFEHFPSPIRLIELIFGPIGRWIL